MLQISPEQWVKLSTQAEDQFIDELTRMAATAYPEVVWMQGTAGLRQLVLSHVEEGRCFGLSYEYALGRYTYWRLDHGDEVLIDPEWEFFRNILEDDTMTELEKVFEIDTLLYGAPLYPEGWDHE